MVNAGNYNCDEVIPFVNKGNKKCINLYGKNVIYGHKVTLLSHNTECLGHQYLGSGISATTIL